MSEAENHPPASSVTALRIPIIKKDDEPVTFAMVALNGIEEDDWSIEIDADHVDLGQDGLGVFDWSEEADNPPVALALMATSSTDSSSSELLYNEFGDNLDWMNWSLMIPTQDIEGCMSMIIKGCFNSAHKILLFYHRSQRQYFKKQKSVIQQSISQRTILRLPQAGYSNAPNCASHSDESYGPSFAQQQFYA
ncbi:hypothetical protein Tco_0001830 [Tanacetum coccineum]